MKTAESDDFLDVWGRVRDWPPPLRVSLATKILQSLEQEPTPPAPRKTLADLVGLWDTGQPPPTDEEVERILEEERMQKYG